MAGTKPRQSIFIAYDGRDTGLATALADAITAVGGKPWLDAIDLQPGDVISAGILEGLREAAVVVVLVTARWSDGRSWYAPEEVDRAIHHMRRLGGGRVVPLLYDDVAPDALPYGLFRVKPLRVARDAWHSAAAALVRLVSSRRPPPTRDEPDGTPRPSAEPAQTAGAPPPSRAPREPSVPSPPIPALLAQAHGAGELAIMVGSGLSLARDVEGDFPGWTDLPRRLLTDCRDLLVGWDDRRVAHRLDGLAYLGGTADLLTELDALNSGLGPRARKAMGRLFRPKNARHGDVHRALLDTGVRALLTTNYDPLIEQAAAGSHTVYSWRQATNALDDLLDGRPIIFKVHGSATDPDSMVLTRRQYDRLSADTRYRAVMEYLLTHYTVLFVGYGMNDPFDLDRLLRGRTELLGAGQRTHFVLMHTDGAGETERWRREFNVHAIGYADHDCVPGFLRALGGPPATDAPAEVPATSAGEAAPDSRSEKQRAVEAAIDRLDRLRALDPPPTAAIADVQAEVIELKRRLRDGGRPKAGYPLDDRWTLIERIGKGGFAEVWSASDRQTGARVAVKLLHGQFADSAERRARFFRGARLMAALEHPGVVRVIEPHRQDAGFHFFVMELVDGGDLRRALFEQRIETDAALEAICVVAEALQEAHDAGMVHRDVKPANILLTADGQGKLTDFDLVNAGDTTGGTRTGALGTFIYAAPEALRDAKTAGPACDVFGLGMSTLAALLGGQPDFMVMRVPGRVVASTGASEALQREVLRAIDLDPAARHPSAAAFAEALRSAMAAPAEESRAPAVEPTPPFGAVVTVAESAARPTLVRIPAGRFTMGSPEDEPGRSSWEGPQHIVRVSRPLLVARTPVTQAQYARVMGGDRPSRFGGDALPVERVSWLEAVTYCNSLSTLEGRTPAYRVDGDEVSWDRAAVGYRLPTEAEWEYACRAGTTTATFAGPLEIVGKYDAPALDGLAWYGGNSGVESGGVDSSNWPEKQYPHQQASTHPVGQKRPNGWGLYDMLGNVREWVWDWHGPYEAGEATDPSGPLSGRNRVVRGGSFHSIARYVRSAVRNWGRPGSRRDYLGFRVVLPAREPEA